MWKQENHLTLLPRHTDNIAKDVDAYLLQLHWKTSSTKEHLVVQSIPGLCDFWISLIGELWTVEEIRTFFVFLKPHNKTTNKTLTIYFTLKWKIIRKEQLQLEWGESAPWRRLFTFAALGIYMVIWQHCLRTTGS